MLRQREVGQALYALRLAVYSNDEVGNEELRSQRWDWQASLTRAKQVLHCIESILDKLRRRVTLHTKF